ncbi:hypothetical protein HDV00_009577 [Rhizophlyctis rosea]|nr:hypothetical protein HDV00_009577 [Rhizophlyctis rosea]
MILFVRPSDSKSQLWDGPRAGLVGAKEYFGADESRPISQLPTYIQTLPQTSRGPIYTDLPLPIPPPALLSSTHISFTSAHAASSNSSLPKLPKMLRESGKTQEGGGQSWFGRLNGAVTGGGTGQKVVALKPVVDELRLVKSEAEIKVMRRAGDITGKAFVEMMRHTSPSSSEDKVAAVAEYTMKMNGAKCMAYVPVVAGGKNAGVIHYVRNDMRLRDGDLVLVDAGAEYGHYVADVTRTWPVNGKFTPAQRAVYEAVLKVQKSCIERLHPSQTTLDDLHNDSFSMLKSEMSRIFGREVPNNEMNRLYPHHLGHWVGMDVHDTGSVMRSRKVGVGMCVTIEPAIYIPDSTLYPPEFRNIGIRIEDDVVVTEGGPEVLSRSVPKEVGDVERVCGGGEWRV